MRKLTILLIMAFIFSIPWQDMVLLPSVGTFSRVLGFFAFVVGIGTLLLLGTFRPFKQIHLLFTCLLFWVALSYFWSIWPDKTETGLFSLFQVVLLALLVWQFIRNRTELIAAYQMLVLGSYVLVYFTIQAWLEGQQTSYNRYAAEGVNENELAAMLGLAIPIALFLLKENNFWLFRIINTLYLPAAFIAIILTASRTGLLTALLGTLYLIICIRHSSTTTRIATVVALVVSVVWILSVMPETSLNRLAGIGDEISSGTFTGRITIWKYGLLAWLDQPLLGYGYESFLKIVNPYSISESPHSSFIAFLVETGVIGLTLFILLLSALYKMALCLPPREWEFQWVLLSCLVLIQLSTEWTSAKITWVLYALLVSHIWLEDEEIFAATSTTQQESTARY